MKKILLIGLLVAGTIALGIGIGKYTAGAPTSYTCSTGSKHSFHATREYKTEVSEYPFTAQGTLTVINTDGFINIEKHDAKTLIIESTKSALVGHLDDIDVQITVHNGNAHIEAIYPTQKGVCTANPSVDYVIKVPADTIVSVENVNGSIIIKDITKVAAHGVNGSIEITGVQEAQLETVSGEISASFKEDVQPSKVQTVNGSVTVYLPASYTGSVTASTINGSVYSDFPRTRNAARVHLETVNGSIQAIKK